MSYGVDQNAQVFDATGRRFEGVSLLVWDAYKRLTTQRGAAWWTQQTEDVRTWLLVGQDRVDLQQRGQRLTRLFDEDPRAEYTVQVLFENEVCYIEVSIRPATSATPLVARINATTGALEVG